MFLKCTYHPDRPPVFEHHVLNTEYALARNGKILLADVNYDKNRIDAVMQELERLMTADNPAGILPAFAGGYFIVLADENTNTVTCFRDAAGIKSGYFCTNTSGSFIVGTQVHNIAKAGGVKNFDPFAVKMLLATEFLYDGYTIYEQVSEVTMGSTLVFCLRKMKIISQSKDTIVLAKEENNLGWEENVKELRRQIVKVHQNLASTNNIVYLSGGIDSCVMLASLDEVTSKENIHSISYRVKGTTQDETVYAKSLSKHLGTSLDVVEIDPLKPISRDDFEEKVLLMNNPYLGMWIFPPQSANNRQTYFGGQDTRLHTPDVSKTDDFVFSGLLNMPEALINAGGAIMKPLHNLYAKLDLYGHDNKYVRNFDKALNTLDHKQYLLNHFFKFNRRRLEHAYHIKLSQQDFAAISDFFYINFKNISNKRWLYNNIVSKKWPEQYTDDIRYMQDMASVNGTYMAMPFYDKALSEWSSSIPYEWGTRFESGKAGFGDETVKINKVMLRSAFRDKLNDEVYYRKKAVSVTGFLLFMGGLGRLIYATLKDDLASNNSFVRAYGLDETIKKFFGKSDWRLIDQPFLLRIYYIAVLCVYHKHLNN